MQIVVTDLPDHILVALTGRLDALSAGDFDLKAGELTAAGSLPVLVDFSAVEYMSSAGLRSLLKMAKVCKASGRALVFFSLQPDVYEVCRIAGFTAILKIVSDKNAALAEAGLN